MDIIVLGGGRLVEGPGVRSTVNKSSETVLGISIGDRINSVLLESKSVDSIIYCGDTTHKNVTIAPVSSDKFFFRTLSFGMQYISHDELVLVLSGDLPLISSHDIEDLTMNASRLDEDIILFYTYNRHIQAEFFGYNENKRYADMHEGNIVFSNTFCIRRSIWSRIYNAIYDDVRGSINKSKIFQRIDTQSLLLLLKIFSYGNVKQLPFLAKMLRIILQKPSLQKDVMKFLSEFTGGSVAIVETNPIFSIDFDRRKQQPFFEKILSQRL